jgi:hypothetical protein
MKIDHSTVWAALLWSISAGASAAGQGAAPTTAAPQAAFLNIKDFGAKCNVSNDDTSAIAAALSAGAARKLRVYVPPGDCKITSSIIVPSGVYLYGAGMASRIFGTGTTGLLNLPYPSKNTVIEALHLDGRKTSGTADIVVLIYAPGTTATVKSAGIVVRNNYLENGSAAIAFENADHVAVYGNTIEAMYRHTSGAYKGSYGYGVVYNGVSNSSIVDNHIGSPARPLERHGIYLPVFRSAESPMPKTLNFARQISIRGNDIYMKHDPANEPYSSAIESWNYFDIAIVGNLLVGGVRGINSSPEFRNGSSVKIIGNTIRDSEIAIRNGPASFGPAPATYMFESYTISGNQLLPRTDVAHQCVRIEGVKAVVFSKNICIGSRSRTAAFLYFGASALVANSIVSTGNQISGFLQGFYIKDVARFTDDSEFKKFTGAPLPYVRVSAISSSEMKPKMTPAVSLYEFNGSDWGGVTYYEVALGKTIHFDGNAWADAAGKRVRGPTANRPATGATPPGIEAGFRYYDENAARMMFWDGAGWR